MNDSNEKIKNSKVSSKGNPVTPEAILKTISELFSKPMSELKDYEREFMTELELAYAMYLRQKEDT